MKTKIKICERLANGSLNVLAEKKLTTRLDETTMTLRVTYQRKEYEVQGNVYTPYIQVK